jgi:hypothetical protein
MSQLSDEDVLRVLREAAVVPAPSPLATAHGARVLALALDVDAKARSRWTTARVTAVALAAAASTGAFALVANDAHTAVALLGPKTSGRIADDVHQAPSTPASNQAARSDFTDVADVPPPPVQREVVRWARLPTAEPAWLIDPAGRVDDPQLSLVPEAIIALAGVPTAAAKRLRCQHSLLNMRDRSAMEACRAFAQEHPQDPAARLLSFAAGRLAEDLGDLAWAEEEYSRSLLLSPFSGLSGTDALLARARVRFTVGNVGEARADLRLYLYSEPAARGELAVASLAAALGL